MCNSFRCDAGKIRFSDSIRTVNILLFSRIIQSINRSVAYTNGYT